MLEQAIVSIIFAVGVLDKLTEIGNWNKGLVAQGLEKSCVSVY